MPKLSEESATGGGDYGPVLDRLEDFGDFTGEFVTFRVDLGDSTPLFKGLPDERCQCPHWGYVLAGKWTVRFPDRDEVYHAGEAFYMPAGHTPIQNDPDTKVVMWSPTEELRVTEAAIMRNMAAAQGS